MTNFNTQNKIIRILYTHLCTIIIYNTHVHFKVILSACSPYFKDLLKGFPREPLNPFIFIRGVRFEDLVSILDFIYYGEVSIAQNELTAFLNLAEELQVKGLTHKKSTKEAKRSINLLSNNESKESTQRLSDNKRQKLVASSKVFTNDGRTNDETYSKDKPTNTSHLGNSNSLMTEYDLTHSDRNNIKHKEKKTLNTRDIVDPSAAALSNESAVSEDFGNSFISIHLNFYVIFFEKTA
jgi:hypothetical protein